MSSGVSVFGGVLLGVGVGDGLDAVVGVGVDPGDAFFIGWWEYGSAKETPAQATKTARVAADWTLAFTMAAKGRRRFLAIMVAIFGAFKAEFTTTCISVVLFQFLTRLVFLGTLVHAPQNPKI
jgi:hypothetical protein